MARNNGRVSTVRRLHRGLGALGAVFLLWMAASGVLINHSDALGLTTHYISSPTLLGWYGLNPPEQLSSFRAGDDWLSFAGAGTYLNGGAVTTLDGGRGAVRTATMLIAAGSQELLLLDHQARVVERLPWTRAGAIEAIGLYDGAVVVRAAGKIWLADDQLVAWRPLHAAANAVDWSSPEPAPTEVREKVEAAYSGGGLSLQRVLLDMHSGRIFTGAGVWAYDLLALLVVVLAGSGLALWVRTGVSRIRNKPR